MKSLTIAGSKKLAKIFGKRTDGTLELCRAKPENRGKGRCYHEEHLNVSQEQLHDSFLQKYNETILSEKYSKTNTIEPTRNNNNELPLNTDNHIQPSVNSKALTKEELIEASNQLSNQITPVDWEFLKKFNKEWYKRASNGHLSKRLGGIANNLAGYLESNSETATTIRGFLGDEVNLKDFSEIITGQVSSMTAVKSWGYRDSNVSRALLTALNNDMNKERYIASVMFFGGRCCYCNVPLRKRPPREKQASGEHLTPISDKNNFGGTRFGNMALACVRCNGDRGSQELVEFVQHYRRIPKDKKVMVLARIKAFRRFALYEDYSPAKNARIKSKIESLNKEIALTKRANGGELTREQAALIRQKIKVAVYDLHGA